MLNFLQRPMVRLPVYAGFGLFVFMLAVLGTFPDTQIKDIIAVEIEKALDHKYSVEIADLDIWWLVGASLENVTISERVDPSKAPPPPSDDEEGLPQDLPMKVTIPSVAARLAPIQSVLSGGVAVAFEIDLGGGVVDGYFANGSEARELHVEIGKLDLRRTLALTAFFGMPFFGDLEGTIDLQLDPKKPVATGGSIDLHGEKLTVGPATVKTDKFPPITYLEIPQTNFGTLDIEVEVVDKKGKPTMSVDSFKWSGRDIRGGIWGEVGLGAKLSSARPELEMRMQLDEGFVTKNSLGPLLNVAEVRNGKNKDWFGFRLYGRLGNLQFKGSPKSAGGPPVKPAGGEEEE